MTKLIVIEDHPMTVHMLNNIVKGRFTDHETFAMMVSLCIAHLLNTEEVKRLRNTMEYEAVSKTLMEVMNSLQGYSDAFIDSRHMTERPKSGADLVCSMVGALELKTSVEKFLKTINHADIEWVWPQNVLSGTIDQMRKLGFN